MRLCQKSALVVLIMLIASTALWAGEKGSISEAKVQRVHRSALLVDTHNDITSMTDRQKRGLRYISCLPFGIRGPFCS